MTEETIAILEEAEEEQEELELQEIQLQLKIEGQGQWAVGTLGAFTPIGRTASRLPPGVYDPMVTNQGELIMSRVRPRTDELLEFPHTNNSKVLDEIERFWTREAAFKQYGIPYKRGILLYGPPGSGKTSTLQLLARGVVEREGIVVIFNSPGTFSAAYRAVRRIQPDTPMVVLMEDIDTILALNKAMETAVLNMLDGVEDTDRVVFLATTNYFEDLAERIKNRPSRFDSVYEIGHPDPVGRQMYLEHLVGRGDPIDIERYVRDTHGMSLAHLKELFVSTVLLELPYERVVKELQELNAGDPNREGQPVRRGLYA